MNLYEHEGKELFKKEGVPVPAGKLFSTLEEMEKEHFNFPVIAKAQTLSGKRGKAGLIIPCKNADELNNAAKNLFSKEIGDQKIEKILVEQYLLDKEAEFYFSITYDTSTRGPVLIASKKGGIDVETLSKESVSKFPVDPRYGLHPWMARQVLSQAGFTGIHFLSLTKILISLWNVFVNNDARLVEVNPLIETTDGEMYAADAKIILDDDAEFRRTRLDLPIRSAGGTKPTDSEVAAQEIDKNDHRGSAGSTYIDLDGDIGIIAAGGGGSLVNMDALLALGGKPANYTEHSGNPPKEKIKKLTEIVLSKKELNGCWFVGATANFTDIYETLSGFVEGLRSIKPKPKYPIVIRRGGPRYEEAFEMLKEIGKKEGYDFHIFGPETPMTSTAKTMVDMVNKFRKARR